VFDQNTNGTLKMVQEYQLFREVPGPETVKVETKELTEEELQRIIEERSKGGKWPKSPIINHCKVLLIINHLDAILRQCKNIQYVVLKPEHVQYFFLSCMSPFLPSLPQKYPPPPPKKRNK
jgi:hypothetical protein